MSGSGTYDVTLNPGATAPILAAGGYCKVVSAPAGQVCLKLDSGETWSVYEGQGFRMPDGQEFSRVLVKNLATLAQKVLIVIGDALFEDTRISGNVRVIDSNIDKTMALQQFIGSASIGPTVAVFSCVGLAARQASALNGSSQKRVMVSSPTAQQIMIFRADSVGTGLLGLNTLQNKKFQGSGGGAASIAGIGGNTLAAALPTGAEVPGYVPYILLDVAASTPTEVPLTTPLVITGTQCLGAIAQTANTKVTLIVDNEEF